MAEFRCLDSSIAAASFFIGKKLRHGGVIITGNAVAAKYFPNRQEQYFNI